MFWIGMIVGIIIGVIAFGAFAKWWCSRVLFKSSEELDDVVDILLTAANNRESELLVVHNDAILDVMTLEEK